MTWKILLQLLFIPLMHNIPKWSDTLWKFCSIYCKILKVCLTILERSALKCYYCISLQEYLKKSRVQIKKHRVVQNILNALFFWSFACCYHCHNILRLFDVLTNFPFTTSETMRDYYLQTWCIRVASRVAKRLGT